MIETAKRQKPIRVGVIGVGRGASFAAAATELVGMEMRRLYRAGEIGRVTYAEGEYNHPMGPEAMNEISPGLEHWSPFPSHAGPGQPPPSIRGSE